MSLIIQAVNLQSKTIEGARWEINSPPGLQTGQSFALSLNTDDKELVSYLSKAKNSECYIDREKGETSIILGFDVKRIRHMFTPKNKYMETLCLIVPTNRVVEQVLTYLITPSKVDSRFIQSMRGNS
jgi:hypothetical protein